MFKPLSEVLQRDPRYDLIVVPDEQGRLRNVELADHHADVAAMELSGFVPDEVRTIFDRARHAYLYAWFDYELTPLAVQQALSALEVALKLGGLGTPRSTLRPLLEEAVARGLAPPLWGQLKLPETVASFRNHWAHGSHHFGTPSMALSVIGFVWEMIDRVALSTAPSN